MTEAEWRTGDHPARLLDFIGDKFSDRRFRLLAIAFVRRNWHLLRDERSRVAVEQSENYADGKVSIELVHESALAAIDAAQSTAFPAHAARAACFELATRQRGAAAGTSVAADESSFAATSYLVQEGDGLTYDLGGLVTEQVVQCQLLRDIFGNPFRPVTFDPRWRTSDVVDVARGIYEDKAFERMPILADALMDAGCEDEQIIGHCRGEGPHVRGCWVVDLVLGKG